MAGGKYMAGRLKARPRFPYGKKDHCKSSLGPVNIGWTGQVFLCWEMPGRAGTRQASSSKTCCCGIHNGPVIVLRRIYGLKTVMIQFLTQRTSVVKWILWIPAVTNDFIFESKWFSCFSGWRSKSFINSWMFRDWFYSTTWNEIPAFKKIHLIFSSLLTSV